MKKTMIGGQAIFEGLLMIGPRNASIAIRKPDGEIIIDNRPLPSPNMIAKIPIIRGAIIFFRQMILGIKALLFSAEFMEVEHAAKHEPSKLEKWIENNFGDKSQEIFIGLSVIFAIGVNIGLFILLPNLIAGSLDLSKFKHGLIYYNLLEGVIRTLIFVGYIVIVSKMKDLQRIYEYHGAEHKTIHCYEHGEELTVKNIKKYSTKHPRCGTAFLFIVMLISILVFSFLGWHSTLKNLIIRAGLMPLIAGLAYEAMKLLGRCEGQVINAVNIPGAFFQLFTTREPDEGQIEVAIAAFNNVIVKEQHEDDW